MRYIPLELEVTPNFEHVLLQPATSFPKAIIFRVMASSHVAGSKSSLSNRNCSCCFVGWLGHENTFMGIPFSITYLGEQGCFWDSTCYQAHSYLGGASGQAVTSDFKFDEEVNHEASRIDVRLLFKIKPPRWNYNGALKTDWIISSQMIHSSNSPWQMVEFSGFRAPEISTGFV